MELIFLILTLIPKVLGNLCTGLQSTVLSHPNSCKKFIICEDELPTEVTCPGDLYFDVLIRSCILHSLAHCSPTLLSTTATEPLPYRFIIPISSTELKLLPPETTTATRSTVRESLQDKSTEQVLSPLPKIPISESPLLSVRRSTTSPFTIYDISTPEIKFRMFNYTALAFSNAAPTTFSPPESSVPVITINQQESSSSPSSISSRFNWDATPTSQAETEISSPETSSISESSTNTTLPSFISLIPLPSSRKPMTNKTESEIISVTPTFVSRTPSSRRTSTVHNDITMNEHLSSVQHISPASTTEIDTNTTPIDVTLTSSSYVTITPSTTTQTIQEMSSGSNESIGKPSEIRPTVLSKSTLNSVETTSASTSISDTTVFNKTLPPVTSRETSSVSESDSELNLTSSVPFMPVTSSRKSLPTTLESEITSVTPTPVSRTPSSRRTSTVHNDITMNEHLSSAQHISPASTAEIDTNTTPVDVTLTSTEYVTITPSTTTQTIQEISSGSNELLDKLSGIIPTILSKSTSSSLETTSASTSVSDMAGFVKVLPSVTSTEASSISQYSSETNLPSSISPIFITNSGKTGSNILTTLNPSLFRTHSNKTAEEPSSTPNDFTTDVNKPVTRTTSKISPKPKSLLPKITPVSSSFLFTTIGTTESSVSFRRTKTLPISISTITPYSSALPPLTSDTESLPSPSPPISNIATSSPIMQPYSSEALPSPTSQICHPYKYYTLPNPENTKTFYYCVFGNRYTFWCPYNYEFDLKRHICRSPDDSEYNSVS